MAIPPSGADPTGAPVLEARALARRFGEKVAVHRVDLSLSRGEYFCIVGPSGSGKTTLLGMLAGFETPDQGEIRLEGTRVDRVPPERRDLNTVFQGYALFPHLSVAENVGFGLRMRGVGREERRSRVEEALTLVGLGGYGPRGPGTLSGGEQQRVALARAVVNRPAVLLLDEPLAALDRKLRLRMQDELRRIQGEVGITFLHITHDQQEALRLGDRLAVMHQGRFQQVGPPAEVYHRPATAFVAGFLGTANLLHGVRIPGEPPRVEVEGGIRLEVGATGALPEVGASVQLAIRPEAVGVEAAEAAEAAGKAPGPAPGGNRLAGEVVDRQPLGGVEELRVRVGGLELEVHRPTSPSRALPQRGARVTLHLDPADMVLLRPEGDPVGGEEDGGHEAGGGRVPGARSPG